jgi:hypothetical protein
MTTTEQQAAEVIDRVRARVANFIEGRRGLQGSGYNLARDLLVIIDEPRPDPQTVTSVDSPVCPTCGPLLPGTAVGLCANPARNTITPAPRATVTREQIAAVELATGLREVVMYQAVCQCCGFVAEEYGDLGALMDPADLDDYLDEWRTIDGKRLCAECWADPGDDAEDDDPVRAHAVHPSTESGGAS